MSVGHLRPAGLGPQPPLYASLPLSIGTPHPLVSILKAALDPGTLCTLPSQQYHLLLFPL